MPELLRLQTPYFEFSVWANDITNRVDSYNNTIEKRLDTSIPTYTIRFAPSTNISASVFLDKDNIDAITNTGSKSSITLDEAVFFENTQYQFEWVFNKNVSEAKLEHRSKNVNEAFRFVPETKRDGRTTSARLVGTINTYNDVGWMSLPLVFQADGKSSTQDISFEVLPTKMALHTDLPAMYDDIDQVYQLWRFSLVQKTEQEVARSKHQGYFPLMWLANFSLLRDKFEKALKVICMAPHSRLQVHTTNLKAVKLKGRINHNLGEKVKQDFKSNHYDKRYQVEKKILSVDTHENRFIKMVVNQTKLKLSKFENKLCNTIDSTEQQRVSESFVGVLHSWQKPLQKVLKQIFMKDVGEYRGTRKESLVLQQKT